MGLADVVLGRARVVDVLQEVLGEDLVGAVVLEGDAFADVPEEVGRRDEVDVEEAVDAVGPAADLHFGGRPRSASAGVGAAQPHP